MIQWQQVFDSSTKAEIATNKFVHRLLPFKELVRTYRQLGFYRTATTIHASNSNRVRQLASKALSRRYVS